MYQKRKTLNAIRVSLEGYLYLQEEGCYQRCGHYHSEKFIQRLTNQFNNRDAEHGGHMLMDGDLGGAVGDPKNSYEEGRWTDWSVEDMKRMLDAKGYSYKDEEPQDVIEVFI